MEYIGPNCREQEVFGKYLHTSLKPTKRETPN